MRQGPDYIQFYPTLRCNRACGFCFNRSLPAMPDMSLAAFRLLLDKLLTTPVRAIDIMGGEPTMHPDIVECIRDATGGGFRVNVSSNGTNSEALRTLMDKRNVNLTVGISINDRGALESLAGFVREYSPVVKSVCSRSFDPALAHEILALRPHRYYLIYHDAMERRDLDKSMPFPGFLAAVDALSPFTVGSVYCSGFLPDTGRYPDLATVRCPAGTSKLAIMPDGSVYPCNLLFGRPELFLGNIFKHSFDSIWHNPLLGFFRTYAGNACPDSLCSLHAQCHGGCPAHGLFHGNSLAGPDPRCIRTLSDGTTGEHG